MLPFRSDRVLEPSLSTKLVSDCVGDCNGQRVLIVGSGAGLLPIRCALSGGLVTAIDIEPEAVCLTRQNAGALDAEVKVEERDFWRMSNVRNDWDVIASNPPQQPSRKLPSNGSWSQHAHYGGQFGLEFICGLIGFAEKGLSPRGRFVCSIFSFLRDEIWMECALKHGFTWSLQASAKKRKGPVTRKNMLRCPHGYREDSLSDPDYEIRVYTFQSGGTH